MGERAKRKRSRWWYFRLWFARWVMPKEVRATVGDVDKWPPMRCFKCRNELGGVSAGGAPLMKSIDIDVEREVADG